MKKKFYLSALSLLAFLMTSQLFAASSSCNGFFRAGNSLLYRQIGGANLVNQMVFIDSTFACSEGTCFYGIFRGGQQSPDVIDGYFKNGSFYFARLIRNEDGRGWKKVLHHEGTCEEYNAAGEFFEEMNRVLGRFILLG